MKDFDDAASTLFSKALATDPKMLTKTLVIESLAVEIGVARSRCWTYQMIADVIFETLGVKLKPLTIQKTYLRMVKEDGLKEEVARIAPFRKSRASAPTAPAERPSARERMAAAAAGSAPAERLPPDAQRPSDPVGRRKATARVLVPGVDFAVLTAEEEATIKASTVFTTEQKRLMAVLLAEKQKEFEKNRSMNSGAGEQS
jgi:hypothetical protein